MLPTCRSTSLSYRNGLDSAQIISPDIRHLQPSLPGRRHPGNLSRRRVDGDVKLVTEMRRTGDVQPRFRAAAAVDRLTFTSSPRKLRQEYVHCDRTNGRHAAGPASDDGNKISLFYVDDISLYCN